VSTDRVPEGRADRSVLLPKAVSADASAISDGPVTDGRATEHRAPAAAGEHGRTAAGASEDRLRVRRQWSP
jgi:hypothetical protein